MAKLYEYELEIDLNKEKGDYGCQKKTYAEHLIIGETADQIGYVNSRWLGERICSIDKKRPKKDRKYEAGIVVNKIHTHSFDFAGYKQERTYIYSTKKLSDKVIYKKLEDALKKYVKEKYAFILRDIDFDFSEVEAIKHLDNNGDKKAGKEVA